MFLLMLSVIMFSQMDCSNVMLSLNVCSSGMFSTQFDSCGTDSVMVFQRLAVIMIKVPVHWMVSGLAMAT